MTKLKNEITQTPQAYIAPTMEVVDIEIEQALLSASNGGQTEDLGDVKDEIGWDATRRRGTWGDLWSE